VRLILGLLRILYLEGVFLINFLSFLFPSHLLFTDSVFFPFLSRFIATGPWATPTLAQSTRSELRVWEKSLILGFE
jgi:hypothetical protein